MNFLCLMSLIKGPPLGPFQHRGIPGERSPVPTGEVRGVGCGWFDSSHELRCGLLVQEHATLEILGTDLRW